MPDLPHTIGGVITKFEDDTATVELDNNEVVKVPKSIVSESATVGSGVHVAVFSDDDVDAEHERLAKSVVAELLRND